LNEPIVYTLNWRRGNERWREVAMTEDRVSEAGELLWMHWQNGRRLTALPEALRPVAREEGYAIQARLETRASAPLFGWKIAATSKAGQAHIAVDGPMAGRLLRERVFDDGATVPFGANHMRVAEAEFAFRMGADLPPREAPYTVDEVLAAVAALHPSIELPDSRFDDFTLVGTAQLIADNACGHYFVLGPAAPGGWRAVDLAAHRVVGRVTGRLEREGLGANVLGDPRVALAWLANELSRIGQTLRAGQVATTGTCVVPLEIAAGDHVVCDFGELGVVQTRLGA
jgi:2-keto-4-pentenoate hydratase